ncbi:MAG: hypothetical protein JWR74_1721 [Polaromonas sp.]|jgi:hypothetical protein|nr:hypothetical protein [Polaromonas sp.]
MIRNGRTRLSTVLFALASLLFMQLALAGYVCPATSQKTSGAAALANGAMPCAESMSFSVDEQQPGLCHAHCQAQPSSADKHELSSPMAGDAMPASFGLPLAETKFSMAPLQPPHWQRTTAPPVAIVNCCFRL